MFNLHRWNKMFVAAIHISAFHTLSSSLGAVDLVQQDSTVRAVSPEEVEAYAESVGCAGVFETSAKDNANVRMIFCFNRTLLH
jgi:hypothetical protein